MRVGHGRLSALYSREIRFDSQGGPGSEPSRSEASGRESRDLTPSRAFACTNTRGALLVTSATKLQARAFPQARHPRQRRGPARRPHAPRCR